MRTRYLAGCAMLLAVPLLVGCGSGDKAVDAQGSDTAIAGSGDGPAKVAAVDPCSFVSAEEIAAITTDKVTGMNRDGKDCYYNSKPDEHVTITVDPTDGVHQMAIMHKVSDVMGGMGAAAADKGEAGKDVAAMLKPGADKPAIGDEALWSTPNTLSVRKGQAFVQIMPIMMHDPASHSGYPLVSQDEQRRMALAIASKVLAKVAP